MKHSLFISWLSIKYFIIKWSSITRRHVAVKTLTLHSGLECNFTRIMELLCKVCSWDKTRDRQTDRYCWGNRCWLGLASVPCFVKLFSNPFRIAPPDSAILKILSASFRANKVWLFRVLLLPQTLFVHCPAHSHVFRDSNGKCLEYLSWLHLLHFWCLCFPY